MYIVDNYFYNALPSYTIGSECKLKVYETKCPHPNLRVDTGLL